MYFVVVLPPSPLLSKAEVNRNSSQTPSFMIKSLEFRNNSICFARPPFQKFSSPTLPMSQHSSVRLWTTYLNRTLPTSSWNILTTPTAVFHSHKRFSTTFLDNTGSVLLAIRRASPTDRIRLRPLLALVPFFSSYIVFISVETTENGSVFFLQIEMFMICLTHQFGHDHLRFIFDKNTGGSG